MITNFNIPCGYKQNELKNVLYLIPKSATKKVHIDGDEAYVEYSGDTLSIIKIKGNNLAFQEDTSFDDRFRFDKTITLTVDGYITFKDFYSKYYAIVEDKSGTFWMANADFPSYITYTYTLNDGENKTDLVFYAASNIPTIKLTNFNPDNAEECETYMPYGIKNLKLLEKNKTKLSTHDKYIITHDDFKLVEAIDGTYELVEEFNGETYTTQLSFSIPLSVYKASWHVKLLEFEENKYRGYLTLKNSDYKAYLGYNAGIFPSYVINGDIVTITLAESSNYGMVFDDDAYPLIYTNIPSVMRFHNIECKTFYLKSSCDWYVESMPHYITMSQTSGNADTLYQIEMCNTTTEYPYAVAFLKIRTCGRLFQVKIIVTSGQYRWINTEETLCVPITDVSWVESGTTCVGYDKYRKSIKMVSYDSGDTWYDSGEYSATTLIEANSYDCGYIGKYEFGLKDYITVRAECDSTSAVTSGDVRRDYSDIYIRTNILRAEIGDCVTSIGEDTFSECSALTYVKMADSVTNIGEGAFSYCKELFIAKLSNSITRINARTFKGCSSLGGIDIPSGVTEIGDSAFSGCTNMSGLIIPSGVTSISYSAFYGCSNIFSLTIPGSVNFMGYFAFAGCSNVRNITIEEGVPYISNYAFARCGQYSTDNHTPIMNVNIPDSVTRIWHNAFQGSVIANVTIGSGVTIIGENAFFSWFGENSSITIKAVNPPTLERDNTTGYYPFDLTGDVPIYVPRESVENYKSNTYWLSVADRIRPIP